MPDNGYGLEELRNATPNTFYFILLQDKHSLAWHSPALQLHCACFFGTSDGFLTISILQNDGVNGVTECPIAPGQEKTYTWIAEQYDKFHCWIRIPDHDGADIQLHATAGTTAIIREYSQKEKRRDKR